MKTILRFEDGGSEEVTVKANAPNEKSEIFRVTCPSGLKYSLLSGRLFRIKLYDNTKTEIGRLSQLWIMIKIPLQEGLIQIGTPFGYSTWYNISKVNQLNSGYNGPLHLEIPHGFISIVEDEAIVIELKSPDIVSWAAGDGSEITFDVADEALKKG